MKMIGYFLLGICRELVCLFNKAVAGYNSLTKNERLAFWWTVLGAFAGMAFAIAVVTSEYQFLKVVRPSMINADYWLLVFFDVLGCGIMGTALIWAIPMLPYGVYLFFKHTINVGKAQA